MQKTTKLWHAIYVRSRAEKKVYHQLQDLGVEAFLPLITRLKQWSDRKKKVEEPLFRSYVFVHSDERDHLPILNVYGVLRFVSFEHKAVVVPDNQIVAIKRYITSYEDEEDQLNNIELKEGQIVRITSGPMMGLTGKLGSLKNKKHIVVYIEAVGQYIAVNISRAKVEPVKEETELKPLPTYY